MLEVGLTPVHLGALVGEDAGHGDTGPPSTGASGREQPASLAGPGSGEAGKGQLGAPRHAERKNLLSGSPAAPELSGSVVAGALGISGGVGTVQVGQGWASVGPPSPPTRSGRQRNCVRTQCNLK